MTLLSASSKLPSASRRLLPASPTIDTDIDRSPVRGEARERRPLAPVSLENLCDVLDDVFAHAWRLVHRRTGRGLFRSNGTYCDAPFAETPSSERGKISLEGDFVTPTSSESLRTGAAPADAGAASSHLRESNSRPIHYEFQEICQTGAPSDPQRRFCPQDLLIAFILIHALTHRLYFLLALPATPAYAVTPALPLFPAISAFLLPRRGEE